MGEVVNIKSSPDWLDQELWNDYLEYRRQVNKPLTGVGEKRAMMKLKRLVDEGHDQTMIVERTIECNWLGLFPQKPEDIKKSQLPSWKDLNKLVAFGRSVGIPPKTGEEAYPYYQRLKNAL